MQIGDKLFKIGFMNYMEYEIVGIRCYKDNTTYEAMCKSCTHGHDCHILICETNGKLEFAGMADCDEDSQHYCHNMEGRYYSTLDDARKSRTKQIISEKERCIEDLKQRLKEEEKRLFELKDILQQIK